MGGTPFWFLVPGGGIKCVKCKKEFGERFQYWRQCCLRLAMVFGFIFSAFQVVSAYQNFNKFEDMAHGIPDSLKDKVQPFFKAVSCMELLVSLSSAVTFVYCMRAWWCQKTDLPYSVTMSGKAWAIFFFTPFVMFIIMPLAAWFNMHAMRRDMCAVTIGGLLNLGPQFRQAWPVGCRAEPSLAALAAFPPPSFDQNFKNLKGWAGYQWCDKNADTWESKVFSSRWTRLTLMGIGRPSRSAIEGLRSLKNRHPGVVPGVLLQVAAINGVMMDAEFLGCCDAKPLTASVKGAMPAALLDGANHSAGGSPGRHRHAALTASKGSSGLPHSDMQGNPKRQSKHSALTVDIDVGGNGNLLGKHAHSAIGTASALGDKAPLVPETPSSLLRREQREDTGAAVAAHSEKEEPADLVEQPHPYGGVAQSAVCTTFDGALMALRSARLARGAVKSFLGTYSCMLAAKALFASQFAIINGISLAVDNVKGVLPHASIPGYILMIAVMAFLPAFMFFVAMFSQSMGMPVMSLAIFMVTTSVVALGWKGYMMTVSDDKKSIKKNMKEADGKSKKAKATALLVVLLWFAWMARSLTANTPESIAIRELFDGFDMKFVKMNLPVMVILFISDFLMSRSLTQVTFTDMLMVAVFDSADDELEVKEGGEVDEDKMALLKEWHAMYPPRKCKKKKKKKKKKDKKKKEWDDSDSDDAAAWQGQAGEDNAGEWWGQPQ